MLKARPDIQQVAVTLNYAKVTGSASVQDMIKTIEQADYQGKVATQPDITLQLTGLNCRNCVNKTQQTLENISGVAARHSNHSNSSNFWYCPSPQS